MGPFQVICVLAAAVLAAGFSIPSALAQYGRGDLPLSIAVAENLDAASAPPAHDLSFVRADGERGRRS